MNQCVLDASVAAKWLISDPSEELQQEARKLLTAHTQGQLLFTVPNVFWAELSAVILKAARQMRMLPDDARASIQSLELLTFTTVSSRSLLETAFSIAMAFRCSLYDCLYVALSQSLRYPVITADKRLVNSLGTVFNVQWLGTLPS